MAGISRRSFLKAMIATAAAPAIVRSESLMKLWVPSRNLILVQPRFAHIASLPILSIEHMLYQCLPRVYDGSIELDRERGILSLQQEESFGCVFPSGIVVPPMVS